MAKDELKEGRKGFRFLEDLTSDVLFEAWGHDLNDVFSAAGEALMSVVCDTRSVKPKKSIKIEARGKNLEDLMFNWLQEIVQAVDVREMFFFRFEIEKIDKKGKFIEATALGEEIRPELGGTHVKGVTYYKFSLKKEGDVWKATASLDI
jgi:SHS2 domain-containing protein